MKNRRRQQKIINDEDVSGVNKQLREEDDQPPLRRQRSTRKPHSQRIMDNYYEYEEEIQSSKPQRKRRGQQKQEQMKDEEEELESVIYAPSDEEQQKRKKVKRTRRTRQAKSDQDSSSDASVDEESCQSEFGSEANDDFCWKCNGRGQVICCDSCFRSFHLGCAGVKKPPTGSWDCPSCLYTISSICPLCEKECSNINSNAMEEEQSEQQLGTATCSKCNILIHTQCILNTGLPLECLLDSPTNRKFFCSTELQQCASQFLLKPDDELSKQCLKLFKQQISERTLFYLCTMCLENFGVGQILSHLKITQDDEQKSEIYYLTLIEQSSFVHCHYILSKTLNQVNQRKLKNYKEKYESDNDDEGILNPQEEEIGEYLEIERVVGCKRVGSWRKMTWKEALVCFEQQEHGWVGPYGSRDNMKVFVKWARLFYDQCSWEDSYLLQKHRKEIKQYFYLKVLEDSLGTPQFSVEKKLHMKLSAQEKHIPLGGGYAPTQPQWVRGGALHAFQLEGLEWLKSSYKKKNNVILADEMGLGKTIQTISFLNLIHYEMNIDGPFLIVAPATTLYNWLKEFKKWAEAFNAIVYTGNQESREIVRQLEFYFKGDKRECKFNALITSYDTAINDQAQLRKIQWEVLVVDEAHRLKNADSKFFRVSSQLETKHKILLTGTPLQNNVLELINLIEFIAPHKARQLKNLESLKVLLNTGSNMGPGNEAANVSLSEEDKKRSLSELTQLLQPHILRRTKGDVKLQVPEMEEIIVKLCLTDTQKFLYKNVLLKNYENLKILDQKNKNVGRANLLNILMSLRLVCNHPFLFLYKRKFEVREGDGFQDLVAQSNKLKFLDRIIPRLLEMEHKLLIFSQFTMMLDLVQEFLERKGICCERLDGNTGIMERQKIIDSFNREDSRTRVFLLSTRAGGLGINLTSADTIIFTDSDFNPYRDLQAISRAHRMGQSKTVKVFRLVSKYTAEERIIEIATKKLLLEEIIINPINKLKKEDFSNIFKNSTWELFNKNLEEKDTEFTEEQFNILLQRNTAKMGNKHSSDLNIVKNDLNDYYLSGFKFTSCNFEKAIDETEKNEKDLAHKDKYWDTLLDGEARLRTEKEFNELGKGKRVKKQYLPNYQDDAIYNNPSEYSPSNKEQQSESEENIDAQVEDIQLLKFRKEIKPPSERMLKLLEKEQLIIKFFQTSVLDHCEMKNLNGLSFDENIDYVVYGFSILHRIDFLDFILHWGIEFESIDALQTALQNEKPQNFKNIELKPQYEELKKYLKEFYALLLDAEHQQDKNNIAFCGLNPIDVLFRVSGLSSLKRKYLNYIKKPEKYVVKHENYVRVKSIKVEGHLSHHPSAWTNYDDFLMSKAILEKGYGNWRLMFLDNTYWNYPIEGEPVWYKLYRKFTDEPSLEEIQQQELQERAQEYLCDMITIKANQLLSLLIETEEIL